MKRFLTIGISIMIIGFVCIMYKTNSRATDTKQYTIVHIKASVPDEMDGDLTITLKSTTDNIILPITLIKETDYSQNISLLSGATYMTTVSVNATGNWSTDVESSYDIPNEDEFTINISVKSPETEVLKKQEELSSSESENNDFTSEVSTQEENKEFQKLIAEISFMCNVNDYNRTFQIAGYSEEGFLEANQNNTKERWNNMTDFEKYVYWSTYLIPVSYLSLNSSKVGSKHYDLEAFLDDVKKGCLMNTAKSCEYPGCDKLNDAFDQYYEYLYDCFVKTRNVYDFLNDGSGHIDIEPPSEEDKFKDLQEQILSELSDDVQESQSSEDEVSQEVTETEQDEQKYDKYGTLINALKKSMVSIILLIIVGGAYLIVKNYNKRKNIYDNEK